MTLLFVWLVVFAAIFTQSLSGFGLALVSMPLLAPALGVKTAAPLVALFGLIAEVALVFYFRRSLSLRTVGQQVVASLPGVAVGILILRQVGERPVLVLLGLVITGYAIYALLNLRLPEMRHPGWAYGAGFLAGMLGGAYNTAGPPVILFGHSQGWTPSEFKGNLQGFFLLNSFAITIAHAAAGNLTSAVWDYLPVAILATIAGIAAGLSLASRINPGLFRRLVLWLLLGLGIRLFFA